MESLSQKRWLCIVSHCHGSKKMFFCDKLPFEQINHIRTAVRSDTRLSLKCRLPNRITFDVCDRCFCKVETRACETLPSCAKRIGGLAVTTLPRASHSFNPVLLRGHQSTIYPHRYAEKVYGSIAKLRLDILMVPNKLCHMDISCSCWH